ncbi:MAG: hypothetical protein AB7F96_13885 [Beijerinckiaceae bacterium]
MARAPDYVAEDREKISEQIAHPESPVISSAEARHGLSRSNVLIVLIAGLALAGGAWLIAEALF